jgi:hypothetical protein
MKALGESKERKKMKWYIWLMLMLVAVGGFAQEVAKKDNPHAVYKAQMKAITSKSELNATLAAETNRYRRAIIQDRIYRITPKAEREAYLDSLGENDALRGRWKVLLYIQTLPRGAKCNQYLKQWFSRPMKACQMAIKFDSSVATVEECREFYRLVLKNVELNEQTKGRLGEIKGELLKLEDL